MQPSTVVGMRHAATFVQTWWGACAVEGGWVASFPTTFKWLAGLEATGCETMRLRGIEVDDDAHTLGGEVCHGF
jgi:hypothetical protein